MTDSPHCDPAHASPQGAHPEQSGSEWPGHGWLRPDWPAPANVRALCTTRAGGSSTGGHASMNLGMQAGDAPEAVVANRARLAAVLQAATPGVRPVFLRQVHGAEAVELGREPADGAAADAAWASGPGLACTIMVADCLPVLFTDKLGRRVAAAHAGWRGLAHGVLERTLSCFWAPALAEYTDGATQSEAEGADGLLAWLGPCIGPNAFEVGAEVRAAFCAVDPAAERHFAPNGPGKFMADLQALARQRLAARGVTQVYGNDGSDAWCTFRQSSRFFSHRRDGAGGTGRMAACIWLG